MTISFNNLTSCAVAILRDLAELERTQEPQKAPTRHIPRYDDKKLDLQEIFLSSDRRASLIDRIVLLVHARG